MSKQRLPWYNFGKLLSYNAMINCVVGARGTGKTFGAKVKGIKDAINRGTEFIYLRRYTDDINETKNTFFADIIAENIFPNVSFKVEGNKGYYSNEMNDKGKPVWKLCVHFYALSTASRRKSVSFPNVTLMIFDEFILDKGLTHYLPSEVNAFLNFYSTVDRNSDRVRVLMLSNSASIMNPYFLAWDIKPTKNGIITKKSGYLAVHFHDASEFASAVAKTRFGQFVEGTAFAAYAVNNEFFDNNDLMVAKKTPESVYFITIETINGGAIAVWYDKFEQTYYGQRKRPKLENIFTLDPYQMSPDKTLWQNDYFAQRLKAAYRHGRFFFDTPQTRNAFMEVLIK